MLEKLDPLRPILMMEWSHRGIVMKRLETVAYEMRPYFLLTVALFGIKGLGADNRIGIASVAILTLASLIILYWRYQHRTAEQNRRRR